MRFRSSARFRSTCCGRTLRNMLRFISSCTPNGFEEKRFALHLYIQNGQFPVTGLNLFLLHIKMSTRVQMPQYDLTAAQGANLLYQQVRTTSKISFKTETAVSSHCRRDGCSGSTRANRPGPAPK